jgi:hypothetical protein
MSLKIENSRRVAKSRLVCMDLKEHLLSLILNKGKSRNEL